MKIALYIFISITIFILFLILYSRSIIKNQKEIVINNHRIAIEISDTDAKRSQGLSDRLKLDENTGMLFIFPRPDYYRFWMYHMNFPLDFIYINKDMVVDLKENVPKPATNENNPPTFSPNKPADKILEINAGKIKEWNIKIGDEGKFAL